MTVVDDDWPAGVGNLQRVSKSWGYFLRILSLEGGGSKGVGTFFKGGDTGGVVVQGGEVGTNPQDGAGPV